jgi:hypothetical protein
LNLRDKEFSVLMGRAAGKSLGRKVDMSASSSSNHGRIRESDFISKGMYQIAL